MAEMRWANLLLLAFMLQGATANLVVNPYTNYNEPPPDAVACSAESSCQGIAECTGWAYCADLAGGGTSCMEKLAPGSDSVPANACDNPQANGFVKCDSGHLYRHCSPRNRDGGMFDATDLQTPSPPPSPAMPPDFANQLEGQLFFMGCGLISVLIVGTVRVSPWSRSLLATPCASHAHRWMDGASRAWQLAYLFHVRWQMDSDQLKRSAVDESKDIKGRMRKGRGQAVRARPACKNRRAPIVAC